MRKTQLYPLTGFTFVVAALFFGMARDAAAAFVLCNKTPTALEAALGYRGGTPSDPVWESAGWWPLAPGACTKLLKTDLSRSAYYYYVRARELGRTLAEDALIWGGPYQFCSADKPFRIKGNENCEYRGYDVLGFAEAEVGEAKSYIIDIK